MSFAFIVRILLFLYVEMYYFCCCCCDLDETRLINKRASECYQHSTPFSTGNLALFASTNSVSSPFHLNRRRQTSLGNMTSYSALKRKAQRIDPSSNLSRV